MVELNKFPAAIADLRAKIIMHNLPPLPPRFSFTLNNTSASLRLFTLGGDPNYDFWEVMALITMSSAVWLLPCLFTLKIGQGASARYVKITLMPKLFLPPSRVVAALSIPNDQGQVLLPRG